MYSHGPKARAGSDINCLLDWGLVEFFHIFLFFVYVYVNGGGCVCGLIYLNVIFQWGVVELSIHAEGEHMVSSANQSVQSKVEKCDGIEQ